jgi:hypothetical protein
MAGRVDQHETVAAIFIMLLQDRLRLALGNVDDQRIGQLARNPRILDPAQRHQILTDRLKSMRVIA